MAWGVQQAVLFVGSVAATLAVHAAVASVLGWSASSTEPPLPRGDSLSHVISVSFSRPGGMSGNADAAVPAPVADAVQPVAAPKVTAPKKPVVTQAKPAPKAPPTAQSVAQQPAPPAPGQVATPASVEPAAVGAPAPTPAPELATVAKVAAPALLASAGKAGVNDAMDGAASRSGVATGADIPAEFTRALLTRLAQHKHYPFKARLAKIEGIGKVYFEVDAAGQLAKFQLTESTRSAELDSAIQHLFRKAFPLPPMVARLGPQQGSAFTLPIAYSLNH